MTKKELYETVNSEVSGILENTKVSKSVREAIAKVLETYLAPKSGGGQPMNPPIEVNGTKYYYCRWHQCYEPENDMVMSKGKSKGYCKAAVSKWNKANSKIKKLEAEATEAIMNSDIETAQKKANEAKELKAKFNLPSYYNYVEDWTVFNKVDTEEGIKQLEEKYKKLKELK